MCESSKDFCFNSECACSKLTYCAYKKKTNDPPHGKLYLSQRQNSEGLEENVYLCSLISVIKSSTQNDECDSMHTLRSANHFKITHPRTLFV